MTSMNNIIAEFGSDKVAVLGFPCNQFGHQTNASDVELPNSLKYVRPGSGFEAQFTLMAKVNVNGAGADPLFKWMRDSMPIPLGEAEGDSKGNGVDDALFISGSQIIWSPVSRSDVSWNFEKWLFDANGNLLKRYNRWYPTDKIHEEIRTMLQ